MKVGDLVSCKEPMLSELGVGIVLRIEKYSAVDDRVPLSICVQWHDDYLWYHLGDLEIVNKA